MQPRAAVPHGLIKFLLCLGQNTHPFLLRLEDVAVDLLVQLTLGRLRFDAAVDHCIGGGDEGVFIGHGYWIPVCAIPYPFVTSATVHAKIAMAEGLSSAS